MKMKESFIIAYAENLRRTVQQCGASETLRIAPSDALHMMSENSRKSGALLMPEACTLGATLAPSAEELSPCRYIRRKAASLNYWCNAPYSTAWTWCRFFLMPRAVTANACTSTQAMPKRKATTFAVKPHQPLDISV